MLGPPQEYHSDTMSSICKEQLFVIRESVRDREMREVERAQNNTWKLRCFFVLFIEFITLFCFIMRFFLIHYVRRTSVSTLCDSDFWMLLWFKFQIKESEFHRTPDMHSWFVQSKFIVYACKCRIKDWMCATLKLGNVFRSFFEFTKEIIVENKTHCHPAADPI